MRYVADCLTALKAVLAFAVFFTIPGHHWGWLAGLIIAIGYCDAFDGNAARAWPYTAEQSAKLFWRRDPHVWDQIPNGIACVTILLTLCILAPVWGIPFAIGVAIGTVGFQRGIIHYGNIDPKKAEHIDIIYGWTWALMLLLSVVFATYMATPKWKTYLIIYAVSCIALVVFKWDRATSRPEVTYGKKK